MRIVGQPQNEDEGYVWMWINDYTHYVRTGRQLRWRTMLMSPRDGLFVVFVNGHLATGIYANSSTTPIDALKAEKGMTVEEAKAMIGE